MHPVVDLTQRLVAIPSENPPGNHYAECVTLLEAELERLDLRPRRITDLILEASVGEGETPLYFHGHYDVVPAQDATQFEPYIDGDRLFGRGTADMKGGLAAMIHAMVALRDAPGRVVLHLVPDEETGGERGSRELTDLDGIGMLTTEPTSGVVWNANRGAISLRVTTHGRPAHVGLAHTGVNAFERMLELANELQRLRNEVGERRTSYRIEPDDARRSILLMGGTISSGANFNVVPGSCTMTVDRRPNPEESLEEEKQRLLDALDGAEVEIFQEAPSAGSPDDGPLAQALADAIEAIDGARPRFELCPGLLETRWYAQRGIPAYAYGPGALEVAHQADEHVEIPRLLRAVEIYERAARALLERRGGRGTSPAR
jgi:acetylornithine deacetylase/succinyl-diaminopimelate desuccinylase family protein